LIWLNFDDEFLLDSVETRHAFIETFRIAQPDVVFCHWRKDYNPDHSISGMIVDECVHMASVPNIKTASKPTDKIPHVYFMDTAAGVNFTPEIYVDITRTFATKVKMLACHVSQGQWTKDIFNCDLESFLEIPAKWRGFQASCPMAEAFRPSYRWGRTFRQHYLPT
jgi:LmbE family N-acetylglucosaminyl deacetylase